MVGGSGTAKTTTALMYFDTLKNDAMLIKRINFSSATTAGMFQASAITLQQSLLLRVVLSIALVVVTRALCLWSWHSFLTIAGQKECVAQITEERGPLGCSRPMSFALSFVPCSASNAATAYTELEVQRKCSSSCPFFVPDYLSRPSRIHDSMNMRGGKPQCF